MTPYDYIDLGNIGSGNGVLPHGSGVLFHSPTILHEALEISIYKMSLKIAYSSLLSHLPKANGQWV